MSAADNAPPGVKLAASDLCYSVVVDGKLKRIVKNVNFGLEPGDLCALMGPSGAGKSTLLDLLADRKIVGTWSGEVYVNDAPRTTLFKRNSAYVLQEDVHIPTLTVEETLKYAAWTRVEEATSELVRRERIEYLLETLGLQHVRNSRVGDAMSKGISGGQLRRLSIAVEIVALPPLIFLDEPTSGLDSSIALEVMSTVRNIINKERIGVTTIHQPSKEIFALFDKLVLMSAGRLIYFGPASEAVAHFTQPQLGYRFHQAGQTKGHRNPAEFILDVCSAQCLPEGSREPRQPSELEMLYKTSALARRYSVLHGARTSTSSAKTSTGSAAMSGKVDSRVYATTMWTQLKMLVHRTWVAKMRDTIELLTDVSKAVGAGLLVGVFYLGKGALSQPFYRHGIMTGDVVSFISFLFVYVLFSMVMNATAIPSICRMTVQYKHDLISNAYAPTPYCIAQLITTLPLRFVFHLLNVLILYWMVDLDDSAASFFYFLFMTFFSSTIAYISALALAALVDDGAKTLAIFPTQFLIWAIFTGFVITVSSLPVYWRWATYITYPKWIFEGLMVNYFSAYDTDDYTGFFEEGNGDVLGYYDFDGFNKLDTIWISLLFMLGFSALFYAGLLPARNRLTRVHNAGDALSVLSMYRASASAFSISNFSLTAGTGISSLTSRRTTLGGSKRSEAHPQYVSNVEMQGGGGSISASVSSFADASQHGHLVLEDPVLQHVPLLGVDDYRQSCGAIDLAQGCCVVFRDVLYAVPNKADRSKQSMLLRGVTGRAMPGEMVALMGASGAGKSTLLDVLAQRKNTGTITGEITYNGSSVMRSFAYVMQDSAHIGILTVRETLHYAAELRLSQGASREQKDQRVQKIIDMLGLTKIANSVLGTSSVRGISGGQLKRVSIGVEIVHLPDLMFLDEPTTGLDSSTSFEVMSAVRNLANQNRTVLCTIHQPSVETYALFDSLLLLAEGRVVYFGPAAAIVDYFVHSPFAFRCKEGTNPADFLVAVAGCFLPAGDGSTITGSELADHYATSEACKAAAGDLRSMGGAFNPLLNPTLADPGAGKAQDTAENPATISVGQQILVLLHRRLAVMRRDYMTVVGPAARELFVGLFLGSVFFQLDTGRDCDNDCYLDRLSLFFFSIVLMLMDHLDDATALVDERLVFYRERGSRAYGTFAYFVSFSLLHFPQMALNTFLYTAALYPMSELRPGFHAVATFYCFLLLVNFVSFFLAVTVAAASYNTEVILNNAVPILIVNILYAGYLMPIPSMPSWQGAWIPYVVFFRFGFQGMVLNEFSGNDALAFSATYIDNLGFDSISVTLCGCILVIFLVAQAAAFLLVLQVVDFEER